MAVTIDGSNTPTAGGVVYGDGTEYVATSAGTSGQVLRSNGASAPSWVTPSGGGLLGFVVYTASDTFTVPSGVTKVKVTITGGGGGGVSGSGWGGAGATAIKFWTVAAGDTIAITIGGAGTGGSGGTGGTSTAVYGATTVSAAGGAGGNTTSTPASATNGDLNLKGGTGSSGTSTTGNGSQNSFWGPGASDVSNGGAYGSGGASTGNRSGTSGVCVVEY